MRAGNTARITALLRYFFAMPLPGVAFLRCLG